MTKLNDISFQEANDKLQRFNFEILLLHSSGSNRNTNANFQCVRREVKKEKKTCLDCTNVAFSTTLNTNLNANIEKLRKILVVAYMNSVLTLKQLDTR
jgi:hypothetical protein